jgi:hypothetical protein
MKDQGKESQCGPVEQRKRDRIFALAMETEMNEQNRAGLTDLAGGSNVFHWCLSYQKVYTLVQTKNMFLFSFTV